MHLESMHDRLDLILNDILVLKDFNIDCVGWVTGTLAILESILFFFLDLANFFGLLIVNIVQSVGIIIFYCTFILYIITFFIH